MTFAVQPPKPPRPPTSPGSSTLVGGPPTPTDNVVASSPVPSHVGIGAAKVGGEMGGGAGQFGGAVAGIRISTKGVKTAYSSEYANRDKAIGTGRSLSGARTASRGAGSIPKLTKPVKQMAINQLPKLPGLPKLGEVKMASLAILIDSPVLKKSAGPKIQVNKNPVKIQANTLNAKLHSPYSGSTLPGKQPGEKTRNPSNQARVGLSVSQTLPGVQPAEANAGAGTGQRPSMATTKLVKTKTVSVPAGARAMITGLSTGQAGIMAGNSPREIGGTLKNTSMATAIGMMRHKPSVKSTEKMVTL